MHALQTQMNVISYRGSGPATTDVLAGRIDVQCDQTSTAGPHIRNGAVKGYAVTLRERVTALPELPTLHESGLRDFELSVWYGLLVPKGSPKGAIDRLAGALRGALADADVAKRLNDFGAQPASNEKATPAGFDAFMRAEVTKWAPIIKAAGVFAD
jgi:tripartite-type tricarboxylate transporter receptor subunit TctC